jgi:predicted enzyme related to lactoylglutathione lyase
MKFKLFIVYEDDQEKALQFYTEVLGFVKKIDVPVGAFKYVTVVSLKGPDDIELLLEPNDNPAARTYQLALFQAGIPPTTLAVEDIYKEYKRMIKLGVMFRTKPTTTEWGIDAVIEDTCGNVIGLQRD